MIEEWRILSEYPIYKVSNLGRVQGPRQILAPYLVSGYPSVKLRLGGRVRFHKYIHSMVLEVFVGPRPTHHVCRHLDGVKTHCHLENLAWGTYAENEADRKLHGTDNSGEANGMSKLTWDEVRQIRKIYERNTRGSCAYVAEKFGVTKGAIWSIIDGTNWPEPPI